MLWRWLLFWLMAATMTTTHAFVPHHHRVAPRRSLLLFAKKQQPNKKQQQQTDSLDFLNDLKKRISETSNPYYADNVLFANNNNEEKKQTLDLPDDCFIVVVRPGTAEQGVHTIEYPPGSGSNVVLAFERKASAMKFAHLLAGQLELFPDPMVSNSSFCEVCHYFLGENRSVGRKYVSVVCALCLAGISQFL